MATKDSDNHGTKPIVYDTLLGAVRLRWDDFIIHLDTRQHRLEFEAYPVTDWKHLPTGKERMSYQQTV
jgi:hypothetical protein